MSKRPTSVSIRPANDALLTEASELISELRQEKATLTADLAAVRAQWAELQAKYNATRDLKAAVTKELLAGHNLLDELGAEDTVSSIAERIQKLCGAQLATAAQARDAARELNQSSATYIAAIQELLVPFRIEGRLESAPDVMRRIILEREQNDAQVRILTAWFLKVSPVVDAVSVLVVAARKGYKQGATHGIEMVRKAYNEYERYAREVRETSKDELVLAHRDAADGQGEGG